jgi:hypothetical protein
LEAVCKVNQRVITNDAKQSLKIKIDMGKNINYFSLFFLLLILCSCTQDPIEFGEIKSFKIDNFVSNQMQCKAEIDIKNKGYFDVEINEGELQAYSDNTVLGTVKLLKPLEIKGNSEQEYILGFLVEITNPEAGMFSFLGRLTGKKPVYSLKGTVYAKSFLVNKKININEVLGK